MAALTDKHKAFIIVRLACYDTPTEVQEKFLEEYKKELGLSQIAYYNAEGAQGSEQLAQKWKDLFKETRSRFNEEISNIPIASQAYRLKKLQQNMQRLEQMRNYKGANETIEQAAKEVGGAFTNKQEVELNHRIPYNGEVDPEEYVQSKISQQ